MLLTDAALPLYTLPECDHSWGGDKGLYKLGSFIQSQSYALAAAGFANCFNREFWPTIVVLALLTRDEDCTGVAL
jgi:hypothetical protein